MATATTTQKPDTSDLREQSAQVKEDIRELAHLAGDAARDQVQHIEDYIKQKPLTSLAIAGGVGLVLGFLFRR